MKEINFSVLSLNCWGVPDYLYKVTKDYCVRMEAIGNALKDVNPDIVCLQEVWSEDDYEKIRNTIEAPYSHYFYSGFTGSGICVLSKWPIIEVAFHQWQVNGYAHKIWHGDWYGGKGVGLCVIDINGFIVNVYNAHLHAKYNVKNDIYLEHRIIQAFDTAQFIKLTSLGADVSILAADLNSEPGESSFEIIKAYPRLKDAFEMRILDYCGTYNNRTNKYYNKCNIGEHIDHILYKEGNDSQVECISYSQPFETRIVGNHLKKQADASYSDHEAVFATFVVKKPIKDVVDNGCKEDLKLRRLLLESLNRCEEAEMRLLRYRHFKSAFFVLSILLAIFITLTAYSGFEISSAWFIAAIVFYSILLAFIWPLWYVFHRIEHRGVSNAKNNIRISLNKPPLS